MRQPRNLPMRAGRQERRLQQHAKAYICCRPTSWTSVSQPSEAPQEHDGALMQEGLTRLTAECGRVKAQLSDHQRTDTSVIPVMYPTVSSRMHACDRQQQHEKAFQGWHMFNPAMSCGDRSFPAWPLPFRVQQLGFCKMSVMGDPAVI